MFRLVKRAYKGVIRWYKRTFLAIYEIDAVKPTGTVSMVLGQTSGIEPPHNAVYEHFRSGPQFDGQLGGYESLRMRNCLKRIEDAVAESKGEEKRRVFPRALDISSAENKGKADNAK